MGHIDIAALNPVEKAVESIPLIILPDTLVSQPWIIASNIRQFRENVEFAFNGHPNLTPQQFTHFVQIMNEITNSLGQTCKDIKEVVDKIQDIFNKNQANSKWIHFAAFGTIPDLTFLYHDDTFDAPPGSLRDRVPSPRQPDPIHLPFAPWCPLIAIMALLFIFLYNSF